MLADQRASSGCSIAPRRHVARRWWLARPGRSASPALRAGVLPPPLAGAGGADLTAAGQRRLRRSPPGRPCSPRCRWRPAAGGARSRWSGRSNFACRRSSSAWSAGQPTTTPVWLILVDERDRRRRRCSAWGMYIGSRRELIWTLRNRAERAEAEQELRVAQARGQRAGPDRAGDARRARPPDLPDLHARRRPGLPRRPHARGDARQRRGDPRQGARGAHRPARRARRAPRRRDRRADCTRPSRRTPTWPAW